MTAQESNLQLYLNGIIYLASVGISAKAKSTAIHELASNFPPADHHRSFLEGPGEMAELARSLDWGATPLGPAESWPQSLKTAASICLHSRFPMLIWWGPKLAMFYNDAHRPILGARKHPGALGQAGRACWPEIWEVIGPMLRGVMGGGPATWSEDQMLLLERNGFSEECYFTFSNSPIFDESGGVGGVFTAVTENTARVLAERRMRALSALVESLTDLRDSDEICARAVEILARDARDNAFAAVVSLDSSGVRKLLASAGALPPEELDHPFLARAVSQSLESDGVGSWTPASPVHGRPWGSVLALPIDKRSGGGRRTLVLGLNNQRAEDDAYRTFAGLAAARVAAALVAARGHAAERERDERANRKLAEVFMHAQVGIVMFSGPQHLAEFANPAYLALVPDRQVVGRTVREVFPDLASQSIYDLLDGVYRTGEAVVGRSIELTFKSPLTGAEATRYFDFVYQAMRDAGGGTSGVVAVVFEVTELARARAEAVEANRVKDEFIAMLGHELRNPLAPIVTALQLMKARGGDALAKERAIVERQVHHMVRLVDDLLHVARIARGDVELRMARFEVVQAIEAAVEIASPS